MHGDLNLTTLADVGSGTWVTVTGFVEGDDSAVAKLLALGIVPGDRCHVVATYPAVLFESGASCYAVDADLASRILVHDLGSP